MSVLSSKNNQNNHNNQKNRHKLKLMIPLKSKLIKTYKLKLIKQFNKSQNIMISTKTHIHLY